MSTHCKSCNQYFKIENKKPVEQKNDYNPKFLSTESVETPETPPESSKPSPSEEHEESEVSVYTPESHNSLADDQTVDFREHSTPDEISVYEPEDGDKQKALELFPEESPEETPENEEGQEESDSPSEKDDEAEEAGFNLSTEEEAIDTRYSAQEDKYSKQNYKHKEKTKSIRCYECNKSHNIIPQATSSMCPSCGCYVALKDFEINETWGKAIKTRGNVIVQKKGKISNITVACHDLKILGDFLGGVDCSGTLTITKKAELTGKAISNQLVVAKKARLTISKLLYAKEIEVSGEIKGNIHCHGKVTINSGGKVNGDISAKSIVIKEGATHEGCMQMISD